MSITSYDNRRSYAGNGATAAFAFPVPFIAAADLKIILRSGDGTEAIQTLATDYTVIGAGNPAGGTVIFTVPPPGGVTVVIYRDVPLTQPLILLDGGPLPAATANGAFDRLTMQVQRVYEITGHALKLNETDPPGSGTYNGGGGEIINIAPGRMPGSAATVSQLGSAVSDAAASATAAALSEAHAAASATAAQVAADRAQSISWFASAEDWGFENETITTTQDWGFES